MSTEHENDYTLSVIQPMENSGLEHLKNELGKPPQKKRGRKSKKQIEKELMNEFYTDEKDKADEKDKEDKEDKYARGRSGSIGGTCGKKQQYENIQYLSAAEKNEFENKFTKPMNPHQEEYTKCLKVKSRKIVIACGPAGTGKTMFATEYGIRNFLLGTYKKLIFTRPTVSVEEDIGYLPGTLEDKMAPWIRPIYDILHGFISPKEVQTLIEEKHIEIAPLGYMRGRTFKNSWIVADEMQNCTVAQMKMMMTRLGDNSRLIITGDLDQHDRVGEVNGLEDFLQRFNGKKSASISIYRFQKGDIQREKVVAEVLDIYDGCAEDEIIANDVHNDDESNVCDSRSI
jgi:phosphate starvation-inducible PhoH-like protein